MTSNHKFDLCTRFWRSVGFKGRPKFKLISHYISRENYYCSVFIYKYVSWSTIMVVDKWSCNKNKQSHPIWWFGQNYWSLLVAIYVFTFPCQITYKSFEAGWSSLFVTVNYLKVGSNFISLLTNYHVYPMHQQQLFW